MSGPQSDLVARLKLEVSAPGGTQVIAGVRSEIQQLGQAGAQAKGGLDQAAAGTANLERTSIGASGASEALEQQIRQLSGTLGQLNAGLQASGAAALNHARELGVAGAATTAFAGEANAAAAASRNLTAAQLAGIENLAQGSARTDKLAGATKTLGAAYGGARLAGGGLLSLVGGPLGLAIIAGTAAMAAYADETKHVEAGQAAVVEVLERVQRQAEETAKETATLAGETAWSAKQSDLAAGAYDRQAAAAAGAAREIREMTAAQRVQQLEKSEQNLRDMEFAYRNNRFYRTDLVEERGNARKALLGEMGIRAPGGAGSDGAAYEGWIDEARNNRGGLSPAGRKALDRYNAADAKAKAAEDAITAERTYVEQLRKSLNGVDTDAGTLVDEIVVTAKKDRKTGGDRQAFNAGVAANDTKADVEAQKAYTVALIAGGKALDDWQVKEAGRQAVERVGLADRPKLTKAQQELVAKIRDQAEATERLKIANERVEQSIGIRKSAEQDTAALQRQAAAAIEGEAALERLQIAEAGLAVLQKQGIDNLDDLDAQTRKHVESAIEAAKAKEAQAIATAKVERVSATLRDLDTRIAAEEGYAAAVQQGVQALIEYELAEAQRIEVERTGKNLTAEQVEQIKAKVKALFEVAGAADEADLVANQREEVRLLALTNQERELEARVLQRIGVLKRQHLDWTKEEVEARARAQALVDQAAADDARAIGDLRENIREAFIRGGTEAFEEVGDFAARRLRQQIYDALIARPFDIVLNAVLGNASGALGLNGLAGGAGGQDGLLGAILGKQLLGGTVGSLLGGAGIGALGASMLGIKGSSNGLVNAGASLGGSALGSLGGTALVNAASMGVFGSGAGAGLAMSLGPLMGPIGAIAGIALSGLLGGKKSNSAAVATLDPTGAITGIAGDKRTDQTTAAATQIAQAVAQVQAQLVASGAKLASTISSIDIGVRDKTHLGFSDGRKIDTAVGDVGAAIDAATKALIDGAQWGSEAATAYAKKMLDAGATLDQVTQTLTIAGGFSESIDQAILKLTDPATFERQQALKAVEDSYQALRKQAEELVAAGLLTGDALTKLAQLRDLQLAELDKSGAGATGAGFTKAIADALAGLRDPTAFKRQAALAEIEADIEAMRAQAQALIASGQLTEAALGQLDALRDARIAQSIRELGDAASDAAASLAKGKDFSSSITDQILQLADPVAYQVKQIEAEIEAMRTQAQAMIAAGTLGADVLGQIEVLKGLKLDEAFGRLAGSVETAVDVFAEARPRIQAWLDALTTGANSPLNPAAQREEAEQAYERILGRARAGDADALAAYTSYADQLLSADQNATSSAEERTALYNRVRGDAEGLMGMSGAALRLPPGDQAIVGRLQTVDERLLQILKLSDEQFKQPGIPKPVLFSDLEPQRLMFAELDRLEAERSEAYLTAIQTDIGGRIDQLGGIVSTAMNAVASAVQAAMNQAAEAMNAARRSGDDNAEAIRDLALRLQLLQRAAQ